MYMLHVNLPILRNLIQRVNELYYAMLNEQIVQYITSGKGGVGGVSTLIDILFMYSHKRNLRKVHRLLHIYAVFHPSKYMYRYMYTCTYMLLL